jgi:hypothetical protein
MPHKVKGKMDRTSILYKLRTSAEKKREKGKKKK